MRTSVTDDTHRVSGASSGDVTADMVGDLVRDMRGSACGGAAYDMSGQSNKGSGQ